jgi:D-alanine-D-alanine ligase
VTGNATLSPAASGLPKPARGGSSIGISKVHDASELDDAIELALREDPKVLVEAAAEGAREVECGVLQALDGTPETSLPAELRVGGDHEFYDFAAKYLPGEHTEIDIPADLPDEVAASLRDLAARAFEAVGCEGLARVDFFVFPDRSLVVNEINTMPGFTPTSMYPQMWAASGIDYPALVDRLIQLALARDTGLR